MRIWQRHGTTETWICAAILEETHHRSIRCSSWSPDGRYLATASFDATTAIWEIQVGDFSISACHAASMHMTISVFVQGSTWEQVALLEGHESEVKGVAWSSSGTHALSAILCTDALLSWHGHATKAFCMTADAVQGHTTPCHMTAVTWQLSLSSVYAQDLCWQLAVATRAFGFGNPFQEMSMSVWTSSRGTHRSALCNSCSSLHLGLLFATAYCISPVHVAT